MAHASSGVRRLKMSKSKPKKPAKAKKRPISRKKHYPRGKGGGY